MEILTSCLVEILEVLWEILSFGAAGAGAGAAAT